MQNGLLDLPLQHLTYNSSTQGALLTPCSSYKVIGLATMMDASTPPTLDSLSIWTSDYLYTDLFIFNLRGLKCFTTHTHTHAHIYLLLQSPLFVMKLLIPA